MNGGRILGTVHVVDDDRAFRIAMGRLLEAVGHRVRLHADAAEFLAAPGEPGPACLLLDLRMPKRSGLDLQRELAGRDACPVIFLSGDGDIAATVQAMKGGALDFLTKPVTADRLLAVVAEALARDMLRTERSARRAEIGERYAALTQRERQVLAGVVAGMMNKQIAYALGISERTAKSHRATMVRKMEADTVVDLVELAEELRKAGIDVDGELRP